MTRTKTLLAALMFMMLPLQANADKIDAYTREHLVDADPEELLAAGKYVELETMAQGFRDPEARFIGGESKLEWFYQRLGQIKENCECGFKSDTKYSFQQKMNMLSSWNGSNPASFTPFIAESQAYSNFAWVARGGLPINKLTEAQLTQFRQRSELAASTIKMIDPKKDYFVYSRLMNIARDLGVSRETLDKIYTAEVKDFPTVYIWYETYAFLLQEKWYGRPGELAAYTQWLLKSPGGETGQVAYTFAIQYLIRDYADQDVSQLNLALGIDWPKLKDAYKVRNTKYGLNIENWNVFGYLGWRNGGDQEALAMTIAHLDTQEDLTLWPNKDMLAQFKERDEMQAKETEIQRQQFWAAQGKPAPPVTGFYTPRHEQPAEDYTLQPAPMNPMPQPAASTQHL